MDLKIKKFYTDQEGGGSDDPNSTVERKVIIDSKFRRETSNFKVNFDASSVDPESEAPVLIKYIEKNLKPEELLGLVTSLTQSAPDQPTEIDTEIIIAVKTIIDLTDDFVFYELTAMLKSEWLFYVPSTGALSLIGPYVEEEEGGTAHETFDPFDPSLLDPVSDQPVGEQPGT